MLCVRMCMRSCVRACVRACQRACVRACVRVCARNLFIFHYGVFGVLVLFVCFVFQAVYLYMHDGTRATLTSKKGDLHSNFYSPGECRSTFNHSDTGKASCRHDTFTE